MHKNREREIVKCDCFWGLCSFRWCLMFCVLFWSLRKFWCHLSCFCWKLSLCSSFGVGILSYMGDNISYQTAYGWKLLLTALYPLDGIDWCREHVYYSWNQAMVWLVGQMWWKIFFGCRGGNNCYLLSHNVYCLLIFTCIHVPMCTILNIVIARDILLLDQEVISFWQPSFPFPALLNLICTLKALTMSTSSLQKLFSNIIVCFFPLVLIKCC